MKITRRFSFGLFLIISTFFFATFSKQLTSPNDKLQSGMEIRARILSKSGTIYSSRSCLGIYRFTPFFHFMSKDFYVGYGWYRKAFTLSSEDVSKKLFLDFDGAEVFVNGQRINSHVGRYTQLKRTVDLWD